MPARTLAVFLVPLVLGACSISDLLPDWTSEDVAGPLPAHRFMIAHKITGIVGNPSGVGSLEISLPRRVDSLKGASWLVCLKARHLPLPPRFYAVFIQQGQIVDSRLSVLVDQCELQDYQPFDWVAEAANPPG